MRLREHGIGIIFQSHKCGTYSPIKFSCRKSLTGLKPSVSADPTVQRDLFHLRRGHHSDPNPLGVWSYLFWPPILEDDIDLPTNTPFLVQIARGFFCGIYLPLLGSIVCVATGGGSESSPPPEESRSDSSLLFTNACFSVFPGVLPAGFASDCASPGVSSPCATTRPGSFVGEGSCFLPVPANAKIRTTTTPRTRTNKAAARPPISARGKLVRFWG